MRPSDAPVVQAQGRKFIPVSVNEFNGCVGCAAQHASVALCAALPKCSGRNFMVIFKELD